MIEMEKYKSLELRLMGCLRTIKQLEKENQAKQEKASSLQLELEKKGKQIESLNQERLNISSSQQRLQVQTTLQNNSKKKERELESKVKDQEHLITDQKKQISRYSELNKQLLDKVKELESQLLSRDTSNVTISDEFQKSRKDVQTLTLENKNLQKSLNSERKKEEYLERELAMMKEKYDNLK